MYNKVAIIKYRKTSKGKAATQAAAKCYYHKKKGKQHWQNKKILKQYPQLVRCFSNMVQRCTNTKKWDYKYYGGRGIECLFKSAIKFINYIVSDLQIDFIGLEIHRIDNDKHYEKGNIEFLTDKEHKLKHKELRNEQK